MGGGLDSRVTTFFFLSFLICHFFHCSVLIREGTHFAKPCLTVDNSLFLFSLFYFILFFFPEDRSAEAKASSARTLHGAFFSHFF